MPFTFLPLSYRLVPSDPVNDQFRIWGNFNITMSACLLNILLSDLYAGQVGQSSVLDELLVRLKDTVDHEVNYMKDLMEIMGIMDTILAASQTVDIEKSSTNGVSFTPSKSVQADS